MKANTYKQHTYIRRRRVMVRLIAVLILAVIGVSSSVILHVSAMEQHSTEKYTETLDFTNASMEQQSPNPSQLLSVAPGDTLWKIAKNYGPDDISVKKYIQLIIEENDLSSANLQTGQVIKLP